MKHPSAATKLAMAERDNVQTNEIAITTTAPTTIVAGLGVLTEAAAR